MMSSGKNDFIFQLHLYLSVALKNLAEKSENNLEQHKVNYKQAL